MALREVHVSPLPIDRFAPIVGEEAVREVREAARALEGRAIWNVNSTAAGGGVAEMLQSLVAYARGMGVDARWAVIDGSPDFFRVTKRLHNALHGERGDGSPLGEAERAVYEATLLPNAEDLLAVVRPGDVVILHDPQTAGLAPAMMRADAYVVWRSHIGVDEPSEETALGWSFLMPYVREVPRLVFSRAAFVPSGIDAAQTRIITPSIDPFTPKNAPLPAEIVRAILGRVGVVQAPAGGVAPVFTRADGTPGRVDHAADITRVGAPPSADAPLVVQISRWDGLKDPIGVLRGFARLVAAGRDAGAELVLAGPTVGAVADDPDAAGVLDEIEHARRELPYAARRLVHVVCLPSYDIEEAGAVINALQRHAAIVVQKSLREGFGLTVTEAMWKARPVVAARVGGIQDQIEHGVNGLLVDDPSDLDAFAGALARVLADRGLARELGRRAEERVRERFLGIRQLAHSLAVIAELCATRAPAELTAGGRQAA